MFSQVTYRLVMSSLKYPFKVVGRDDSQPAAEKRFSAFTIMRPDIYLVASILLMQSYCRQMCGLFLHKQGQAAALLSLVTNCEL